MSHDRRARPTLRLLCEDLPTGWEDSNALRAIESQRWSELHPFAELNHPLIRKSVEQYGSDPADDPAPQGIDQSKELRLLKVRFGQWRGAIWIDPDTGVRWLCFAGLAKGGHKDHDDAYNQIGELVDRGRGEILLPTDEDKQLLKRETATWLVTAWELQIQTLVAQVLERLQPPSTGRFTVPHPIRNENLATVEVTITTDAPDIEDYVVEINWIGSYHSTNLGATLIRRVLTSIAPRAQEWDRYQWTYSQIAEAGHRERRIIELLDAARDSVLLTHEPGTVSHYGHKSHLAKSSIEGEGVRALCGVFFVVTQDHTDKPICPECEGQFARLPR